MVKLRSSLQKFYGRGHDLVNLLLLPISTGPLSGVLSYCNYVHMYGAGRSIKSVQVNNHCMHSAVKNSSTVQLISGVQTATLL